MKNKSDISRMTLSAMFLALAYILPFFTGQIPQIGNMLCPMHIPVFLCGFLCGGNWGILVGILVPLLRSATLGVPIMYPMAICMSLELGTYGFMAGILYRKLPRKKMYIYVSLILSMISGRLVWGMMMFFCAGVSGTFGFSAFLAGALTNAIPGIILQLVMVPLLVVLLDGKSRVFVKSVAD